MAVTGRRKLLQRLKAVSRAHPDAVRAAVYEEALAIMAKSVEIVPVDTGRLRASHYVAPPAGDRPTEIGYGTTYALPVHEREELTHAPPTRAKFLKIPVDRARPGFTKRIAKRARRHIRRGTKPSGVPATAPTRPKSGRDDS